MSNMKLKLGTKVNTRDKVKSIPSPMVSENTKPKIPVAGKFEKVSFETFLSALMKMSNKTEPDDEYINSVKTLYDNIIIPKRINDTNPIYNIYFPFGDTVLIPNETIVVPTGIKVKLEPGWCLQCTINPLLAVNNDLFTHEIITYITPDRYNNPTDEGMIMFKIINTSRFAKSCTLNRNIRLCSCLFIPYGLSSNDMVEIQEGV